MSGGFDGCSFSGDRGLQEKIVKSVGDSQAIEELLSRERTDVRDRIAENLEPGDRVVWLGRPAYFYYVLSRSRPIVSLAMVFTASALVTTLAGIEAPLLWHVGTWAGCCLGLTIFTLLRCASLRYVVTERYALVIGKFERRKVRKYRLDEVEFANTTRTLDRAGSILFEGLEMERGAIHKTGFIGVSNVSQVFQVLLDAAAACKEKQDEALPSPEAQLSALEAILHELPSDTIESLSPAKAQLVRSALGGEPILWLWRVRPLELLASGFLFRLLFVAVPSVVLYLALTHDQRRMPMFVNGLAVLSLISLAMMIYLQVILMNEVYVVTPTRALTVRPGGIYPHTGDVLSTLAETRIVRESSDGSGDLALRRLSRSAECFYAIPNVRVVLRLARMILKLRIDRTRMERVDQIEER